MSGNKLFTSDDLELKGSFVRKRNRSQQSQNSVDNESNDGKDEIVGSSSFRKLPHNVIEIILSNFSFRKMLDLRLLSKRWNSVILGKFRLFLYLELLLTWICLKITSIIQRMLSDITSKTSM